MNSSCFGGRGCSWSDTTSLEKAIRDTPPAAIQLEETKTRRSSFVLSFPHNDASHIQVQVPVVDPHS